MRGFETGLWHLQFLEPSLTDFLVLCGISTHVPQVTVTGFNGSATLGTPTDVCGNQVYVIDTVLTPRLAFGDITAAIGASCFTPHRVAPI